MDKSNSIGWQRLIVITAIGTGAVILADRLGIVNAIAERINGGR
jgi:hypothetical protein